MRLGACQSLAKALGEAELVELVAKAVEKRALRRQNVHLKGLITQTDPPRVVVGESKAIREVLGAGERLAESDSPVLSELSGHTKGAFSGAVLGKLSLPLARTLADHHTSNADPSGQNLRSITTQ
ncbi:MAG: hypothetical protein ACE5JN_09880 [Candidatus Methylomirabilia bacterium]